MRTAATPRRASSRERKPHEQEWEELRVACCNESGPYAREHPSCTAGPKGNRKIAETLARLVHLGSCGEGWR